MAFIGRFVATVLALSLGILPAGVSAADAAAPSAQELPVVTLVAARRETIQDRIPLSGSLLARRSVQVHANVAGYEIREIRAEVGDRVKAGDVLVVLDDATLKAQLAQAEAEEARAAAGISQAESQIASAEASLTQAVTALQRTRALRQSGNASQAVLDQAVATEAAARAAASSASDGLGVARAAQQQAAAARRIAALNLGYAQIIAPVDGVVVARTAELGALSGGADPLFTLIDKGEIEMAADVIETTLGGLKPGDPALIRVAGLGEIRGHVRLVPAAVDPITRLGSARIALDADPRLRIGMYAQGWVVSDQREAVTVPASAILADEHGDRVQVVKDGKVDSRVVRAGTIWQDRREILEGVSPGETVIARAGAFFRSGDMVKAAP